MVLSVSLSSRIIDVARSYVGHPYDWNAFDRVHFVIKVYRDAGIEVPRFTGTGYPPSDLHLTADEFTSMPLGHSVFFKRKKNVSNRIWTHMALIVSPHEMIHCSRHFGGAVVITPKSEFMEIYNLVPKLPI